MTTSSNQQQPLQNLYHRRLVAPTSQKACYICHKPTAVVLITPDNRDHFYVCGGHLTDRGFAIPEGSAGTDVEAEKRKAEEEKKKDEELQKEIEKVKREYAEKLKKRKGKKKKEERDAQGKRVKDDDDDFPSSDEKKDEAEKDAKVKELEGKKAGDKGAEKDGEGKDDGPRVFVLQKNIFAMRTSRIREAQMAKKRAEAMKSGTLLPSVPRGGLG